MDEILKTAGLAADPDLARFVHARSEGNPLYVATLARVLAARPEAALDADAVARVAGASAEISHLVSSLTAGLDEGTRDLLAAASVLGTEFGAELAAAVGGGQDVLAALAAAEARGTGRTRRHGSRRHRVGRRHDRGPGGRRPGRGTRRHPCPGGRPLGSAASHAVVAAGRQDRRARYRHRAADRHRARPGVADRRGLRAGRHRGGRRRDRPARAAGRVDRLPLARWHLLRQQASRAALAGQLAVARDRSEQARQLAVRIEDLSGAGISYSFAAWLAVLRGDAAELQPDFFEVMADAPAMPIVRASHALGLFAACLDRRGAGRLRDAAPAAGGRTGTSVRSARSRCC